MTVLNISIICLSLKYVKNKYENISNISKWIYHELVRYNYNNLKLIHSLDKKDYKIIKSIIKFNENKDMFNSYLINFCKINKIKLVKLLLDNGANIHVNTDLGFRWASYGGHIDIVKLLLNNGADIHAFNDEALILASIQGHFDVVKFLIDNNADIHAENDYALKQAYRYNRHNIVKLLIDNGANESV